MSWNCQKKTSKKQDLPTDWNGVLKRNPRLSQESKQKPSTGLTGCTYIRHWSLFLTWYCPRSLDLLGVVWKGRGWGVVKLAPPSSPTTTPFIATPQEAPTLFVVGTCLPSGSLAVEEIIHPLVTVGQLKLPEIRREQMRFCILNLLLIACLCAKKKNQDENQIFGSFRSLYTNEPTLPHSNDSLFMCQDENETENEGFRSF